MATAGKVSFAEQLSIRCKPYFDGLLNSGIEKFDEYVKTLNQKSSSVTYDLDELKRDMIGYTGDRFDEIVNLIDEKFSPSQDDSNPSSNPNSPEDEGSIREDVEADENKLDDPPSSGKVSVLNLVAQLQKDFNDYVNKDDKEMTNFDEKSEKEEKEAKKEKAENKKERAAAKSTANRNLTLLERIAKKVWQSKFGRIMKTIGLILGSALLLIYLKPIWRALIAELCNFLGVKSMDEWWEKQKENISNFLQERFPGVYEALKDIKEFFDNSWEDVKDLFTKVKTWWEEHHENKEQRKENANEMAHANSKIGGAMWAVPGAGLAITNQISEKQLHPFTNSLAQSPEAYLDPYSQYSMASPSTPSASAEYTPSMPSIDVPSSLAYSTAVTAGRAMLASEANSGFTNTMAASDEDIKQKLASGQIEVDQDMTSAYQSLGISSGTNEPSTVYRTKDDGAGGGGSIVITNNMKTVLYDSRGDLDHLLQ